jgi:chemotaxis family two-component system response regulator Rcp1
MPQAETTFEILVIDDNPGDSYLIQEAWSQCQLVRSHVSVLENSKDAVSYLRCAAPYKNSPKPHLVMLDYKMPVDGGIALTEIKGDPDFLHTPVIVISGSSNPKDFLDAYQRHANCCFRKPNDLQGILDLITNLAETWLIRAVIPYP